MPEKKPRKSLKRTMTSSQQHYADNVVPVKYREQYKKAMSGESRTTAVKLMCYSCCGFEDVARRVSECNTVTCPLWPYRKVKE